MTAPRAVEYGRCALALVAAAWLGCGAGGAKPEPRAPPSNLTADTVLVYGVGHRDGSVSLIVHRDGSAELSHKSPDGGDKQVRSVVEPNELSALAELLRRNRLCDLESKRTEGVPDEARPSIAVRLEDLDCRIELWDNEFQADANARACLRAVQDLASAVEKRAD